LSDLGRPTNLASHGLRQLWMERQIKADLTTSVLPSKAPQMKPRQRWLSHFKDEKRQRKNNNVLNQFEKTTGVNAEVLLERTRARMHSSYPEDAEDAFQKFYDTMRRRRLKHDSVIQYVNVVRGFFRANGVPLPPFPLVKSKTRGPKPRGLPFNQREVKRMVGLWANAPKSSRSIARRNRAVIAFLAQTGQKESVLAGITWEMVHHGKESARRNGYPSYALVDIDSEFPDDQPHRQYPFVIGSDTMRLMEELPRPHTGKVFKTSKGRGSISVRTIQRIVDETARRCGLQREKKRRYRGWKSYQVTPEVFRKYWKFQMRSGGVEDRDLLNYMMGLGKSASDEWSDSHLLRKYRKAERKLVVLPRSSR
jgi:integrase